MAALEAPAGAIGWQAKDFTLEDAYGNPFRMSDLKGPSGTLVMFICNHCPYVRAIADRIARDARDLQKRGVGVIAVMPNDYVRDPDDAPKQMKRFAKQHDFSFPTSSTRCRRWCARRRAAAPRDQHRRSPWRTTCRRSSSHRRRPIASLFGQHAQPRVATRH